MRQRNLPPTCPTCGASLPHDNPMSKQYHEHRARVEARVWADVDKARGEESRQGGSIYREEDRARLRSGLNNEQHLYVTTLENVADAAFHVWENTPDATMPPAILNDLYEALAKVDFMEGDELRDQL